MAIERVTPGLGAAVLLALLGCSDPPVPEASPVAEAEFVGSEACGACHEAEYIAWQSSHHALAMQTANAETVLGDFSNAVFDYFDTTIRFRRHGDEFYVETQGGTGHPEAWRVTHTFGVAPLQQYLVELPGGRRQAMQIAWDTRSAAEGGQRWFHLYPDEYIGPEDPLYWGKRYFNWNVMCAECHSTDVDVGYDLTSDTFATAFEETSVGCEACHGPGSLHADYARTGTLMDDAGFPADLDDRKDSRWLMNPETGIAELSEPAGRQQQPESCGRCHARRSVLTADYEYGKLLTDTHMPALLEEGLYFADGRILDEVYVYGSFLQSRMYRAGVTCTDCHDPHSAGFVTAGDSSSVCAQCHLPAVFATAEHGDSTSTDCVGCHMPSRVYMGVDERHDHSFRIPDAGAQPGHYGNVIAAGRAGHANPLILQALDNESTPAIARATLLTLLRPTNAADARNALDAAVGDQDPLVRIGALRALRVFSPEIRLRTGSRLLRDPVRGVRVEAADTYADLHDLLPLEDARAFSQAAEEYREAQLVNASMPESLVALAEFESRLGNDDEAEEHLQLALRREPDFPVARYSYGLLLVRAGRHGEALDQLRYAYEAEPSNSRYAYTLGVALNSLGFTHDALQLMRQARQEFPDDFDIGWALATMLRDERALDEARAVARELDEAYPDSAEVDRLLDSLAPEGVSDQ